MGANHDLERDLELNQTDAEDVKGGGIITASATVGGVSASVDDLNTSASAGGISAGTTNDSSGVGVGVSGAGTSAKANSNARKARTVRKRGRK